METQTRKYPCMLCLALHGEKHAEVRCDSRLATHAGDITALWSGLFIWHNGGNHFAYCHHGYKSTST